MNTTRKILCAALLAASPLLAQAQTAPLAAGQARFLGSVHSPTQIRDFATAERPLPESLGGGVPWHGPPWGYSR